MHLAGVIPLSRWCHIWLYIFCKRTSHVRNRYTGACDVAKQNLIFPRSIHIYKGAYQKQDGGTSTNGGYMLLWETRGYRMQSPFPIIL